MRAELATAGRALFGTPLQTISAKATITHSLVATFIADLSSQAAVRRLAAEVLDRYPKLDVLVNNAGAMYGTRQLTKDGIELTWAINHLAPFLLSKLLLPRAEKECAGPHHHNSIPGASGSPHPVRRSQR